MLLKQSLPEWAVREAGAPQELWTEIVSPPYSDNLFYDVVWVDKTPTRLPEVRSTDLGRPSTGRGTTRRWLGVIMIVGCAFLLDRHGG